MRTLRHVLPALLCGIAALSVGGCSTPGDNRSMESVHQPVVTHDTLTYDARVDGSQLAYGERERLAGWLETIDLRYGDHVVLGEAADAYGSGVRESIANMVANYGLLLQDGPVPAGVQAASDGAVRVIVYRASASVPGCPNWADKQEANGTGSLSGNYGCATNSNLAAMIANPEDLVRGQVGRSDLRTATSNRAIQTYRDKQPTGAGALQTLGN